LARTVVATKARSTKKERIDQVQAGGVKLVRLDVRDVATVVVYKLIQNHK
jgi:hypothetical protein